MEGNFKIVSKLEEIKNIHSNVIYHLEDENLKKELIAKLYDSSRTIFY